MIENDPSTRVPIGLLQNHDNPSMDASSALSALTRTPSPFSHYQTAYEGTSSRCEDVSDISSPGEAVDDEDSAKAPCSYRDALQLPRELRLRCQIHLEEQYYIAALNLLNSTLCEGISHACAPTKPALVPPPNQLALLATLAIHPKHTSKLTNANAHDVASLSLSYLRSVLATVGPVNANLRDAFSYRSGDGGRTRRRNRRDLDSSPLNGLQDDEDIIRGNAANGGSIWLRGEDFWKVLGWALNCSALYPHRWRWWKPWLEFMLDMLEADYEERKRLDEEHEGKKTCYESQMLQKSLLVSYIAPRNMHSNPIRFIMAALFADGASSSLSMYKEVFNNETKVASKNNKKRRHHRLDLENDNFGDYDDDSSIGGSEPPTPQPQRTSGKGDDSTSWTDTPLAESVHLRLRVFALLTRASWDLGNKCRFSFQELHETFANKLRQLPLPAFTVFLAGHDSPLDEKCVIGVIQGMLPSLLPASCPNPRAVDPDAVADNRLSPAILVGCYLPFASRTADNNAKLSIALETLIRLMWTIGDVSWTPELQEAVDEGIKARKDKSAPPKRGRKDDGHQGARDTLRASASRLLALTKILKKLRQVKVV